MNIVIGTTSESKINALKKSLKELDIEDYNIIPVKAKSNVRDNPINEETKVGAQNRNNFIKEYCETNNIDYDILISIEAGYTKENEDYYIDSFAYAVYKDQTYFGQSPRVKITKDIFNYAYEQKPLHVLINEILNKEYIDGFIGFFTNDKIKRADIESYSISQALGKCFNIEYKPQIVDYEKYINNDRLKLLDKEIGKRNLNKGGQRDGSLVQIL